MVERGGVWYNIGASKSVAWVRACNLVKFETGRNLPPVLKIVTHSVHTAHRRTCKPFLLSM